MVRRGDPLWLVRPTRFAGAARRTARVALGVLPAAMLAAAVLIGAGIAPAEPLHRAIVAAVAHGGDFYGGLRELMRGDPALRTEGLAPPTLAVVEAMAPAWAMPVLAAGLLSLVLWLGTGRLLPLFGRTSGRATAVILLLAGIAAGAVLWTAAPHAGWAAVLVALALLARHPGRWIEPAALACAAALIDPGALVAVVVMAVAALAEGRRPEAAAWAVAGAVAGAAFALHCWAWGRLGMPIGGGGAMPDAVGAVVAGVLPGITPVIGAPAVLLALLGWAALPDALGLRVVAVLVAGVGVQVASGLTAALPVAILLPVGLAFAPDAINDLARRAIDRRRITVTRITR